MLSREGLILGRNECPERKSHIELLQFANLAIVDFDYEPLLIVHMSFRLFKSFWIVPTLPTMNGCKWEHLELIFLVISRERALLHTISLLYHVNVWSRMISLYRKAYGRVSIDGGSLKNASITALATTGYVASRLWPQPMSAFANVSMSAMTYHHVERCVDKLFFVRCRSWRWSKSFCDPSRPGLHEISPCQFLASWDPSRLWH